MKTRLLLILAATLTLGAGAFAGTHLLSAGQEPILASGSGVNNCHQICASRCNNTSNQCYRNCRQYCR